MNGQEIIAALPYTDPFLFVDEITEVSDTHIKGSYTFAEDSFFYKGHFKNNPVTPGVILTECMAQIGLVSLGIYLLKDRSLDDLQVAFTGSEVEFIAPVFPNEKIMVTADLQYFRFNKLKCKIKLYTQSGELSTQGTLSGMFSLKK